MHLGELVMELTNIKIGEYIELYSEKCNIPNLTNDDVLGINKDKKLLKTKRKAFEDLINYEPMEA